MKNQLVIIVISLVLVSCAITGKKHHYTGTRHNNQGAVRIVNFTTVQQNNSGIIYGNIQTQSRLRDITFNKILSNGTIDVKNIIDVRTFSNGNFIVENLKPGNYIISSVETRNEIFNLFKNKNHLTFFSISVEQKEVVYAGTYKVFVSEKNDATTIEKMHLVRSAIPTEKKILSHVSRVERHSIWSKSLRVRMSKLI